MQACLWVKRNDDVHLIYELSVSHGNLNLTNAKSSKQSVEQSFIVLAVHTCYNTILLTTL